MLAPLDLPEPAESVFWAPLPLLVADVLEPEAEAPGESTVGVADAGG